MVMLFNFRFHHFADFMRVDEIHCDAAENVGNERYEVMVRAEARVARKDGRRLGIFDMLFEGHVALLPRHPRQQKQQAERIHIVGFTPTRAGNHLLEFAQQLLDCCEFVADQHRHRARTKDDQQLGSERMHDRAELPTLKHIASADRAEHSEQTNKL
jgi:hypothetical protein